MLTTKSTIYSTIHRLFFGGNNLNEIENVRKHKKYENLQLCDTTLKQTYLQMKRGCYRSDRTWRQWKKLEQILCTNKKLYTFCVCFFSYLKLLLLVQQRQRQRQQQTHLKTKTYKLIKYIKMWQKSIKNCTKTKKHTHAHALIDCT